MNEELNDMGDDVQEFKKDVVKVILLGKHISLLRTINKLIKEGNIATPVNVIKEIYSNELSKKKEEFEQKNIIRKHKSKISGELSILRNDLGVVKFEIYNPKDRRCRKYFLTPIGEKLLKYSKLDEVIERAKTIKRKRSRKTIPKNEQFQIKEIHSRQIKKLIDQLINDLPSVDKYGAYYEKPNEPDKYRYGYDGEDLSVERSNVLYSDLKNHLGTFISFKKLEQFLGDFKQISKKVNKSKEKVKDLIFMELQNQLQLQFNETSDGIDVFCKNLVNWVNNALKYRIDKGDTKDFKENFIDFSSEHKEMSVDDTDVIKIYIGGAPMMTIENTDDSSDRINHLETILKNLMSNIEKTPFFIEYQKKKDMVEDLEKIRTKIISGLERERELTVYPSDCPYTGNQVDVR